jgi:hypothetical protein
VSTDTYADAGGQHHSQVEPDSLSFGSTIVSAFQSGRFFDGGASNIGIATSKDGGHTWAHGFLPGTTTAATPPGKYARTSDASVAYDPKHNVWMVSYLGIVTIPGAVDVDVSRSTDGGVTWGSPVVVSSTGRFNDKNWTVCDTHPTSPLYGNCYTEFDDNSLGDLVQISTSPDGGGVWFPQVTPAGDPHGLGGQPLVLPNGHVVVPLLGLDGPIAAIVAVVSVDGGISWSAPTFVTEADSGGVQGNLRADIPLPSAEIDKSGTIYVAWADCRFRPQCSTQDIVFSTSPNGTVWSAVHRVPIDGVTSGADHFLPGLAVDANSTGSLGLLYYFYPRGNCAEATCQLEAGFITSINGGSSWSAPQKLAGPMSIDWLPDTSQGRMVGDYFSTSIVNHVAYPMVMVAKAPAGTVFSQSANTVGVPIRGGQQHDGAVAVASKPIESATALEDDAAPGSDGPQPPG